MIRVSALFFVVALALISRSSGGQPGQGRGHESLGRRALWLFRGHRDRSDRRSAPPLRTSIWWQEGGWNRRAQDTIAVLDVSNWHGINNARYGAGTLEELMDLRPEILSVEVVTYVDLALSAAMLAYVDDQASGRADPSATNRHSQPMRPSTRSICWSTV